jgi:hypothetical protein
LDVIQPVLVFGFLGAVFLMVALRTVPADERPWLRNWLVIAYVSRIGVAVFFEIFRTMRIFHEDSEGYEAVAVALAKSWWEAPRRW